MRGGFYDPVDHDAVGVRTYGESWLESCLQETLLPGAPWHLIEEDLSAELATRVAKQFRHPERKAALLSQLGEEFARRHLSDEVFNTDILDGMSSEEVAQLTKEAQSWLQHQLTRVIHDLGYQQLTLLPTADVKNHNRIAEFFQHVYTSFNNGLDRHLYLFEKQLIQEKHEARVQQSRGDKPTTRRSVLAPSLTRSSTSSTVTANLLPPVPQTPSHGDVSLYNDHGDPPHLWGPQSDVIGQAVVSILETNPRKLEHVVTRLHGRQLPNSLRAYIWADVLFKVDRRMHKDGVEFYNRNAERAVRERFGHMVQRGMVTRRVKHATQSPIHRLISNNVSETYRRTAGLIPYPRSHQEEAARALNILHVYDQTYEPYLTHWLFPLQIAFPDAETAGEHVYDLAMYLDLLRSYCYPKWPQIYAIANGVMKLLQMHDQKLHDHLKTIARIGFDVNPKEFMVQLILQERGQPANMEQNKDSGEQTATQLPHLTPLETVAILTDPIIFLRKWIGEGFVGALDGPAIMFVWDQFFMSSWQPRVMENICLALLLLLSHKFMAATDYSSMKQVFLHEASKLYTADIQRAWVHLENDLPPSSIPQMNRQRPRSPSSQRHSPMTPTRPTSLTPLHVCAIRDIRMILRFPAASMKKAAWLKQFHGSSLAVNVSLHFGSVQLQTKSSSSPGEIIMEESSASGNCVIYARLPKEIFAFDDVDLSEYDVEKELGGYPYLLVNVSYLRTDTNGGISSFSLGWARAKVFHQEVDQTWYPQHGDLALPLHPGAAPEGIISPSIPPSPSGDDILGYNSELRLIVFDPSLQHTPPAASTDIPWPPPHPSPKVTPLPVKKTPTPVPATPRNDAVWVERNPDLVLPAPVDNTQTFDVYIDSLRYIPDNASIVKVTGRFFRTGKLGQIPDILALPNLQSSARSPTLSLRMVVNDNAVTCDPNMMLMLRVYTVDIVTELVVVVGSCILPIYVTRDNNMVLLNVGGHQLPLHHGLPPLPGGPNSLTPTFLDQCAVIPACSILVRLLPHTQEVIPAPPYSSGYYQSERCKPSQSERRIFASYQQHMSYPSSGYEMIDRLRISEGIATVEMDDPETWLKTRLERKEPVTIKKKGKKADVESFPENVDLVRCVRYRLHIGLNVQIRQAYGLKGAQYVQCFGRVVLGSTALGMKTTDDGYGGLEKCVTLRLDYDGLLSAPKWLDTHKEMHPFYDEYSCLIIQVFGLRVQYKPTIDHSGPGAVTGIKGATLDLGDQAIIGWAVVPLFHGNSVLNGHHYAPLLRGKPSREILEALSKNSVTSVLKSWKWSKQEILSTASICVTLWDAHFDSEAIPTMPTYESELQAVGDLAKYRNQRAITAGNRLSSVILGSLQKKDRKGGTAGEIYKKEEGYFDETMRMIYYDLIESALMTAGFGPL